MSREEAPSSTTTIVHDARRGEVAPDEAIRQGRVEVVLVNAKTGAHESYGQLLRRRSCGAYRLRLSRDAASGSSWIVATRDRPPRTVVVGFRRERLAECEQLFDEIVESSLDVSADVV